MRRQAPRQPPRQAPRYEIVLQNPNRYPEAAARRLRPWVESLVSAVVEANGRERRRVRQSEPFITRTFGIRFAGDREVRRANRAYRQQDKTTDVLSFPGCLALGAEQTAREDDGGAHLGDVLISVPAARRQAAALGHDSASEIEVLLLHGLLHCLGYDHEADGGEMARLERRLRRQWVRGERRGGDPENGGKGGEADADAEGDARRAVHGDADEPPGVAVLHERSHRAAEGGDGN